MASKGAPKLPDRDMRDISKVCSSICRRRVPDPCPMKLLPRNRFRFCEGVVAHVLCTFTSEADRALKPSIETDHEDNVGLLRASTKRKSGYQPGNGSIVYEDIIPDVVNGAIEMLAME
ncbi:hypothetical protein H106_05627 [Trichophyton rubrum CBS 735.88]|nr:hypothetical protein H106_05627 [Trichophyton rubrum CBS 735.88]